MCFLMVKSMTRLTQIIINDKSNQWVYSGTLRTPGTLYWLLGPSCLWSHNTHPKSTQGKKPHLHFHGQKCLDTVIWWTTLTQFVSVSCRLTQTWVAGPQRNGHTWETTTDHQTWSVVITPFCNTVHFDSDMKGHQHNHIHSVDLISLAWDLKPGPQKSDPICCYSGIVLLPISSMYPIKKNLNVTTSSDQTQVSRQTRQVHIQTTLITDHPHPEPWVWPRLSHGRDQ